MRMQNISKSQFAGLNDKRFYFYGGIVSMPFGHLLLEILRKQKKKETHIYLLIKEKKEEYLNAEAKAVRQCERLQVLRFFLLQAPVLYKLNWNLIYHKTSNKELRIKFTLVMILLIVLIFVVATILNYATKRYLRRAISWKCSHSW